MSVFATVQVAPAQPPKLAADAEIGTKPEEADEEVSRLSSRRDLLSAP